MNRTTVVVQFAIERIQELGPVEAWRAACEKYAGTMSPGSFKLAHSIYARLITKPEYDNVRKSVPCSSND